MVGILVSFWDDLFSGSMLVSGSVFLQMIQRVPRKNNRKLPIARLHDWFLQGTKWHKWPIRQPQLFKWNIRLPGRSVTLKRSYISFTPKAKGFDNLEMFRLKRNTYNFVFKSWRCWTSSKSKPTVFLAGPVARFISFHLYLRHPGVHQKCSSQPPVLNHQVVTRLIALQGLSKLQGFFNPGNFP